MTKIPRSLGSSATVSGHSAPPYFSNSDTLNLNDMITLGTKLKSLKSMPSRLFVPSIALNSLSWRLNLCLTQIWFDYYDGPLLGLLCSQGTSRNDIMMVLEDLALNLALNLLDYLV